MFLRQLVQDIHKMKGENMSEEQLEEKAKEQMKYVLKLLAQNLFKFSRISIRTNITF